MLLSLKRRHISPTRRVFTELVLVGVVWSLLPLAPLLTGSSATSTSAVYAQESVTFGPVLVAQSWPTYPFPGTHKIARGPGGYLCWWKILLLWLVFVLWVKTTDWVSRDCREHGFPYATWVPVVFAPFLAAFFLAGLTIPVFAAGFAVTFLTWLIPIVVYVVQRNRQVELHERVMTKDHIRFLVAELLSKAGLNVDSEAKAAYEKGAPVSFSPLGGESDEQNQANLLTARQSDGFLPAKEVIQSAFEHRADKVMLDVGQEGMSVRFQVDGVWHDGDDHDPEEGELLLEVLKTISGLNPEEHRARQSGKFGAEVDGTKLNCAIVSQATKTGERALVQMGGATTTFKTLAELGMREKMIEQYKDLMLQDHGILILSSMPTGGLSSTLNVSLRSTDRLLRDFVSLESIKDRLEEVENVDPTIYNPEAGESPAKKLPTLLRKQPDVLVVPDLPDAETVSILCEAAIEDNLIFTTIRAKEAVEALLRVLLLKVPAKAFAPVVVGVLNQRLVRKLCEACKEPYAPPPALLQKLGIPPGRVEEFFRHPEEPEEVCPECHGIGYLGRTAIFELLTMNKQLRQALIDQPKLETLRNVARQSGHRTLQEEGIAAVVRGITSLPELMRVLKQ